MKVEIPPGRATIPIWYEQPDGNKFVQFVHQWNWPKTIEIPDGSKVLTLDDLLKENA